MCILYLETLSKLLLFALQKGVLGTMSRRTNATVFIADEDGDKKKMATLPPSTKIIVLNLLALFCAYITPVGWPPLTTLPFVFGLISHEKKGNKNPQLIGVLMYATVLTFYPIIVASVFLIPFFNLLNLLDVWTLNPFLASSPLTTFPFPIYLLSPTLNPFFPVLSLITLYYVVARSDMERHSPLGKVLMIFFWDPPFLIAMRAASWFGERVLHDGDGRFMSEIDKIVSMSSLPQPADVPAMVRANVVGVVNMCRESEGPIHLYKDAGITQLWLPTYDASAPAMEDLEKGVKFIKEIQESGKGRVLVHCKGGRGRATCTAISYFVASGMELEEAMDMLCLKRKVVERVVGEYAVIKEFAKKQKENGQ